MLFKRSLFSLLLFLPLIAVTACKPRVEGENTPLASRTTDIKFASYFDLAEYTGKTYLEFMKDEVKPAMDKLATDGYTVASAEDIERAYKASDEKIKSRVDKSWGGLAKIQRIATKLAGKTVTLNSLPGEIKKIDSEVDIYDLATFIGLSSGGGVKIKYFEKNYALNVHYDVKEERSGRSFGVGPTRGANDASDKQYLDDLQTYVTQSTDNLSEFYHTLISSLVNSDSSNYENVTPEGQTVLTDFLAVFTAEQARNLMDGRVSPHWDAALMEVTLLAAFHAGQKEIKLFYQNPDTKETSFTSTTLKQTPCAVPTQKQDAMLRDYWQFSRNINSTQNCRRSGINITKDEFRELGKQITGYIYTNHRDIFDQVMAAMELSGSQFNLFESLSVFLISKDSPPKFSKKRMGEIVGAWVALLEISRKEASKITSDIEAREHRN